MIKEEDIIGREIMGGWPIYKMTLREILISLGASQNEQTISFDINNPILDLYPKRLISDAMGYGIDEQFIVEASTDNKSYVNFFTEPFNQQQVSSLKEGHKAYERKKREYLEVQNDEFDYGHNISHSYSETE